jgi:hypothetical protein
VIDPLVVGGYLFGSTLLAPAQDAAEIRRILEEGETAERERERDDPNELAAARLKRLELKLLLCLLFFPPAGAVIGFYYFGLLREIAHPPRGWIGGIVMWVVCLLLTAVSIHIFFGFGF